VEGIPVRHGRLVATLSHGNLVLLGTEAWSNVTTSTRPTLDAQQALTAGGERFGLLETPGQLWMQPTLELAPMARADAPGVGEGYRHHLVWTYGFQNPGESERWKVTVDAETGEVLALEDDNHYLDATVKGGIYPLTSTEICANNEMCGSMQVDSPMPWANTGLAAPNNFTDGAGVLVIAGVVFWMGAKSAKDGLDILMDRVDPAMRGKFQTTAAAVEGVVGVQNVRVHPLGSELRVDMEISVDGSLTVERGHKIAHAVETAVIGAHEHVREVHVHVNPAPMPPRPADTRTSDTRA
jgi:hypothetical protein